MPAEGSSTMLKRLAAALVAVVCVILTSAGVQAQDSRTLVWDKWDVVIDNVDTTNNVYRVSERYAIRFSGTFQFGSAVIPFDNVEDIRDVRVSEGGQPLQQSCSGVRGTYCVRGSGDEISITYYFRQPITNASQTFEISYTVVGNIRVYEGGDQLWWIGVPDDHFGFPINSSTITVKLPEGYAPREGVDPIETYGARGEIEVNGTTVIARAVNGVGRNEAFELRVQYPHDPNARVPSWQAESDRQREYDQTVRPLINIGAIGLSLLIGLGGPLLMYVMWQRRGRDPKVGPVPEYLSEPPSNLPPAVVGTLVDETSDPRDVISTVVDLAHRGYLVIEEEKSEGIFGIGGGSSFTFKRTDKPDNDLRSYERRLLNRLFGGSRMERSLDSLKNTFYTTISEIQNDLYDELVKEGFFATKPNTTRAKWSGIGAILLVIAFGVGGFLLSALEEVADFILCIPVAIGVTAIAAFIVGTAMPAKTRKGAEEAAKWLAFYEYLRNLEKYADVKDKAVDFDKYLPYAVAFNIDRDWVRKFTQSQEHVPIPPWYYPTYLGGPYRRGYVPGTPIYRGRGSFGESGGLPGELVRAPGGGFSLDEMSGNLAGGLESISSGLTSMVESASRAMTSRPQQTSGGSGSWKGGGRSWSGGGFSGGGGGGGGSRGFG